MLFKILCTVLLLAAFVWCVYQYHHPLFKKSEKAGDYDQWVGYSGFVDTDDHVFLDENKKIIPELSEAYLDSFVYGYGIRYVPCTITKIRNSAGILRIHVKPQQVYDSFRVVYVGDFGIILRHNFYGDLFLGDFSKIPEGVCENDVLSVKIRTEKLIQGWRADFEIL